MADPFKRADGKKTILLLVVWMLSAGQIFQGQTKQSQEAGKNPGAWQLEPRTPSATALGDIFFKSRNSFIFSVGADATVQDNVFVAEDDNKAFDTLSNVFSRIAYQRQYQRTSFALDYTVGGRFYNRYDSSNQVTHDGGFHIQRTITPRLTFTLGDRFSISPDAGRLFRRDLVLPQLSPDISPNSTLILRLNKTILNTTYGGLSYQVNQRSSVAFGANGSLTRFEQGNLREDNRYGGSFSYSYRLSDRTSLSLGYGFTYFTLTDSQTSPASGSITSPSIARNHNAYIGISHQFTSRISAYVNVGPNYTIGDSIDLGTGVRFQPGLRTSVNGGIVLSESLSLDPRTFLSFSVNQKVSDGFGLGAIVQNQTAGLTLGRRFTRRTTAAVNGGYARNQFLNQFDEAGEEITTNTVYVGASMRYNLTERLSFGANYSYYRQLSTGFYDMIPGNLTGNTASVGLVYSIPLSF
jgi:hypothetical protein